MKVSWKFALPLCIGVIGGAAIVEGLHAQTKSPVLYIVEISDITNAEAFKAVSGRSNAAAGNRVTKLGGHYVARTDHITALDGTALLAAGGADADHRGHPRRGSHVRQVPRRRDRDRMPWPASKRARRWSTPPDRSPT